MPNHDPAPTHTSDARPIVIIGAGAVGLCIAEQLLDRGLPVTIIDKSGIAAGASFGNAGLVSYGHPPLARPGMFRALLRSMTSPRSPLYLPPRSIISMASWLHAFRRACRDERLEHAMRTIVDLSRLAREGFERCTGSLGLQFDYREGGYMDVHRDEHSLEAEGHIAELTTRLGIRETRLTADQAIARQPALREGLAGAILHEDAAYAHPGKFCQALADHLRARGVTIITGAGVEDIAVQADRATGVALADGRTIDASAVVLAAGAWSPAIARKIGIRIPMQPAKGYHTTIESPNAEDAPPPITEAINFSDDWVAATPMDAQIRLAGTLEFDGMNHTMRDDRVQHLLDAIPRNLRWDHTPEPNGRWCGLRPCTADGMPIIGWSPSVERFFIATGHAMMGFWTAPATGTLAAQLIAEEPPSIDPHPFRVERF
ncbi:MAG: NAD(P)/FAD-dependent oxidoreductase [Phycisphaerales bacterium]